MMKKYKTRLGASEGVPINSMIERDLAETKNRKHPPCMLCGKTGCYICRGTGLGYSRDVKRGI